MWKNWRQFVPSKRMVLGITTAILAGLLFIVTSAYKFLAVTQPVGRGILVVEAWIPAQTLAESENVFNSGGYSQLVVVGGPIQGRVTESNDPSSYDDLAAKRLEALGFDTKKLVKLSVPTVSNGNTLANAMAFKHWLVNSGNPVCCVDVFTTGVHARRSWIEFQGALGDRYRVGIISGTEVSFDPRFWFFSRKGIWKVTHNLVGYAFYKLWFLVRP